MPIIVTAAAALAIQATPQIELTAGPAEPGQAVRLSYAELAQVVSPAAGPTLAAGAAEARRPHPQDFAWATGVRTVASSTGAAATSQAMTSLVVQARIRD